MERITSQPGTINAFEFARLYAKVSGYLEKLKVDRGSRVKKASSWRSSTCPSWKRPSSKPRRRWSGRTRPSSRRRRQVTSAKETIEAKQAFQEKAEADVQAAVADREYRNKQFNRIDDLVKRHAVEERLRDE